MMAHFEKRLSSETKFEGRVITVTLDRVELDRVADFGWPHRDATGARKNQGT